MASLKTIGIETLQMDVLSDESVKAAVAEVSRRTDGRLDVLLNNAGTGYSTPLMDASLPEIAKLFELNTLSCLRVTQHFLPLLRKAKDGALLVNNTSVASVMPVPLQGPYSMSKAATGFMSEVLRLELQPFNIKVVDLKTGTVKSNFFANTTSSGSSEGGSIHLPPDSLYAPGKEQVEKFMRADGVPSIPADQWAEAVVKDLSKKNPPYHVWRGGNALQVWLATLLPVGLSDGMIKKMSGLDIVERYYRGLTGPKTK
ncbi:NADPH-dependent 1-acyl dihydroxyacetone phosphate reductase [Cladophialophora chaetospira]|uniref:NADPH-dependent 1-acyl dihydroxyacetone phosphate reductase n=1 Tax=Cladophialophora chaetospira TaxID=386627 RepID=A0AA38XM92_9EURO|nr:NADPH-dependent 1-acyl dihydroxyacetone phosphate reductase [Cladophialophora chaetospira]